MVLSGLAQSDAMEWKHKKVSCKLMLEGNGNQITFHNLFVIFTEKIKEAEFGCVRLISTDWPNGPLIRALIGGAKPFS